MRNLNSFEAKALGSGATWLFLRISTTKIRIAF